MFSFHENEFLATLADYNEAIWPLQIISLLLGLFVLVLTFENNSKSTPIILVILALLWLWTGVVFNLIFWAPKYNYAYFFGAIFIVQAMLMLRATINPEFNFHFSKKPASIIGFVFMLYAVIGYQLVGITLGHVYPQLFAFGLVNCPTTIFTLGVFMLAEGKLPRYLLIIPLIEALTAVVPVIAGVYEDIGLLAAGVIMLFFTKRQLKKNS